MTDSLQILIVDDSEDDALLLVRHLRNNGLMFEHARVDTADGMRAALESSMFDAVLCDYNMPRFGPAAAMDLAKSLLLDIPFIVVSGTMSEDQLVDLMKSGAHDVVQKGNLTRLVPAIKRETADAAARREQREAKAALWFSEERYRILYNKTPVMLHSIDAEGRLVSVSDYWLKHLGYERSEALGRQSMDFMTKESRQYARDVVLPEFLRTGACTDIPYQFVKKNGEIIDMLLSATAELSSKGEVIRSLAVLIDVTERTRAEQALGQSEAQFRGAFETAPHGMALVDLEGRWLAVNQALCDLIGYSEEEMLQMNFRMITHPEDLERNQVGIGKLIKGDIQSYEREKRYVHKDGHFLSVLLSVSLVRDGQGNPAHMVSQIFDLTERKETEAHLRQAQKMETVGQLTGGIAHDFNNLLAVILGNLQLLERSLGQDEKTHRRVRSALEATERGADLTKRLLAFSRKQALEPRVIDINELVDGMGDLLFRTLGGSVEVCIRQADDPWFTNADPSQLESAILNLAINARDAMPDGGKLTIETANMRVDEEFAAHHPGMVTGDYVLVSVSDCGTGIPEELLSNIFQPFFTTKDIGKGSGLGLSMVHGYVKQTGGYVQIDSEEGVGTTVNLFLPREKRETAKDVQRFSGTTEIVGGKETILVVEDDPDVRRIAVSILEDLGYKVLQSHDGPSALVVIEEDDAIDLLFSDIIMPGGMNGMEMAEHARDRNPNLKVLHTSGFAEGAVFRSGESEINFDLIGKPYRRENLAQKVREVLDG